MNTVETGRMSAGRGNVFYKTNKAETRAIIMLGLNTVKNLVLATSILSSFKGNKALRGPHADDFWEHSLGVGATARVFAKRFDVPLQEQEEYFVTGLLHDLGKLPMMASFPTIYIQVINMGAEQTMRSVEVENHLFGFDHCQVNQFKGQTMQGASEREGRFHLLAKTCGIDPDQISSLQTDIQAQIEMARIFLDVAGKGS